MRRKLQRAGQLQAGIKHFLKVTRSYWPGLFHCYDVLDLLLTARHFAQSPDLYVLIQMRNPQTPAVTAAFLQAAENLRDIAQRKDYDAFRALFDEVRAHLGAFTQPALAQSDFLIDRLVERT